jgi:hypothetical protein
VCKDRLGYRMRTLSKKTRMVLNMLKKYRVKGRIAFREFSQDVYAYTKNSTVKMKKL